MTNKTPNALPPTVIQLGDKFNTALTLDGARQVQNINILSIGGSKKYRRKENGVTYPYHMVDIYVKNGDGFRVIRSENIYGKKNAIKIQREVTRKLAVFLFENRNS